MMEMLQELIIHCDNPQCDYEEAISYKNREKWIGIPCPRCGKNLLTREDFEEYNRFNDFMTDPIWQKIENMLPQTRDKHDVYLEIVHEKKDDKYCISIKELEASND